MKNHARWMVLAAVFGLPAICLAEEIDNPAYLAWARFGAGSSVSMISESDVGGTKTESTVRATLLSINAERALVETKLTIVVGGAKTQMPARKTELPAKIDKPEEPATQESDKPDKEKPGVKEKPGAKEKPNERPREVTEEVEVGGKSYTCKVEEASSKQNGIPMNVKKWTSEEIPGGVVKVQTVIPEGPMKGTTTATATAVTIK